MHSLAMGFVLAQQTGGGNALVNFVPLLLIIAVFYLLLIRPQQRKAKQHQQLVQSVGTGDRVVTIGGIHGTVETLDDDTVRIEVAPGTVITMTRAAIARRVIDADAGVEDGQIDATEHTDPTETP